MRFVALLDTPLAWLKAGIGWHASTSRGSGRQGLAATYEMKRKLAWTGCKGYGQVPGTVDACRDVKSDGESSKASPLDDGSAKLKPRVQRVREGKTDKGMGETARERGRSDGDGD
jgi:hypothetical protein